MKNKIEICELPDDLLVNIISRLTWREAVATSILSTRWCHLYTYVTRLAYSTRHPAEQSKDKYAKLLQEHTNDIYMFLASSKSCRFLKEFKVHIPCMKGANVKTWLPAVLQREVESICIGMIYHNKSMSGYYNFPRRILIKGKGGGLESFPGLKSLRQLSLHSLHVDDRDVELFVSNCTILEHLSIMGSYRLKNVSLVRHSKLKYLEISSSRNVLSIEISDMINLVCLTCRKLQPKYSLHLNNVPKLAEFNSSDQYHLLCHVFLGISSSVVDQLTYINVHSTDFEDFSFKEFTTFTNLKHLKFEMKCRHGDRETHYYIPLWKCPSLQKLEMKFQWRGNEVFRDRYHERLLEYDRVGKLPGTFNENLKEVTFSGFIGCKPEITYSWFLMRGVDALEEIVVELCDKTPEIRQKAADIAWEHFPKFTPPSTNLVII